MRIEKLRKSILATFEGSLPNISSGPETAGSSHFRKQNHNQPTGEHRLLSQSGCSPLEASFSETTKQG